MFKPLQDFFLEKICLLHNKSKDLIILKNGTLNFQKSTLKISYDVVDDITDERFSSSLLVDHNEYLKWSAKLGYTNNNDLALKNQELVSANSDLRTRLDNITLAYQQMEEQLKALQNLFQIKQQGEQ